MPPTLADLAAALAPHVDAERYHAEGDPAGVWIASDRPVRRLGLRLDAGRAPYGWLSKDIDALLVHRPFGLWPARLPAGLGVLAVHHALDDLFATGHNPALARTLGLALDDEPLRRDGRVIGMVGTVEDAETRVVAAFGGAEATAGEPEASGRVAVVGAMTEALVRDAAERGVGLYVTGQMRQPAMAAVRETGMRVVAVGQGRSERWGLRYVGGLLAAAFPGLTVVDLDEAA
ncbi:MAG TPA: Nif3-like dinuclear metal center hexameric protein [Rubricoccaceae bacterium]|jgi:putative NIF3 family GTP cyclohydrolase 1 type 2